MPETVPTNERLRELARKFDMLAALSQHQPFDPDGNKERDDKLEREHHETAAACRALIAVRAVLEDLSPIPLIGRLRAILGPQGGSDA